MESSGTGNAFQTIAFNGEASLTINGDNGGDTFNVTPSASVPIFIDGGNPVSVLPGEYPAQSSRTRRRGK